MRILVTGKDGQVGWECVRSLQCVGTVIAVGRAERDLADAASLRGFVRATAPDLIVNTAAYTAVDRAESDEPLAHVVNATAPAVLAEEAKRLGAGLIHLSTDYVFDGRQATPYVETDAPAPLSAYGRSKLAGEQGIVASGAAALILRTSWVYAGRGRNFLLTMLRLAREREEIRVVDDQWGAPTWARSAAEGIAAIVARAGADRRSIADSFAARGGVFHMTAAGRTTWFRFAEQIFAQSSDPARRLQRLVAIGTDAYPTPAARPANSVLDCTRLAREWQVALPPWQEALSLALGDAAWRLAE